MPNTAMFLSITVYYGIAFAAPVILIGIARLFGFIINGMSTSISIIFKYLAYREIPHSWIYSNTSETFTFLDLCSVSLYIIANGIAMLYNMRTLDELRLRSGVLAIINLIPLGFNAHSNILSDKLKLSTAHYSRIHRWIGRVSIVQCLVHLASNYRSELSLQGPNNIGGILVCLESS